jgi:hypothetical protein
LNKIYESVSAITDAKALEDNFKMNVQRLEDQIAKSNEEKETITQEKMKAIQ